jgi:probable rRNA maturation factor|tara:strand:+ start:134 stop:682 length:549 start_codon:yes stop_codon:yes gene_type:complete
MKTEKLSTKTELGLLHIDVTVDCSQWNDILPGAPTLARNACYAVFNKVRTVSSDQIAEVSILLSNNVLVRSLNSEYRNRDEPTNVLSFPNAINETPLTSLPLLLGDIVVAFETLVSEASAENKSKSDHLCHLIIHGMLHLLGFDHQVPAEADIMENIEINILQNLNVANPYQVRASKGGVST